MLGDPLEFSGEDKCSLFQGCPVENSIPGFFCLRVFDPKLGEGRVLISGDGTQALLLWFHVDDLLLHGFTLCNEKGLDFISAEDQLLGLIYQSLKLMPPEIAIHELFSNVLAKNNDKCGQHM